MIRRTSLTRFAPLMREVQPDQGWEQARKAWHEHGIVCLDPEVVDSKLGWMAAQMLRNIGEQAFGKRKIKR